MTMPAEGYTEEGPQNYYESHAWEAEPLGNLEPKQHTRRVPEFSSCMTWVIPQAGVGQPVQVLQRQPQRFKAKILVDTVGALSQFEVVGANPAAGSDFTYTNNSGQPQQLVSIQGLFTADATVANRFVRWIITDAAGSTIATAINGTATVASTTIRVNGFQGATQQNSSAGTFTAPVAQNLSIPPGGTVQLVGVAGGSADTWTQIRLELTQSSGTGSVVFNSRLDPVQGANPQGFTVAITGSLPDWESQQPLYAIAIGGSATLSIWDETYAVR